MDKIGQNVQRGKSDNFAARLRDKDGVMCLRFRVFQWRGDAGDGRVKRLGGNLGEQP